MGTQNPNVPGSWSTSTSDSTKLGSQAEKAAEQIASSALDRVQSARDRAESGLSAQRGQVTRRIRRVGDALRVSSDELRLDDEVVADYLEKAGDRVERIAAYVSSASPSDLARDVHRFASERPAWFFGGTFLLGLAAGRFLKSSAGDVGRHDYSNFKAPYNRQAASSATASVTTTPTRSVGDRPASNVGYSEPRVYGSLGTNGDKPNLPSTPGAGPGSRTS